MSYVLLQHGLLFISYIIPEDELELLINHSFDCTACCDQQDSQQLQTHLLHWKVAVSPVSVLVTRTQARCQAAWDPSPSCPTSTCMDLQMWAQLRTEVANQR